MLAGMRNCLGLGFVLIGLGASACRDPRAEALAKLPKCKCSQTLADFASQTSPKFACDGGPLLRFTHAGQTVVATGDDYIGQAWYFRNDRLVGVIGYSCMDQPCACSDKPGETGSLGHFSLGDVFIPVHALLRCSSGACTEYTACSLCPGGPHPKSACADP